MKIEEIAAERRRLEAQIDLAVRQFAERCGLRDWQIGAVWGRTELRTAVGKGPYGPAAEVYTATVTVRV